MPKYFNFDSIQKKIPKRSLDSHKGNFGRVMIIGGSEGMGGAAILSSEASLFCGSGLVYLNTHPSNVEASLIRNPEIMALGINESLSIPNNINILLCGPGLKNDKWSNNIFNEIFKTKNIETLIFDAGALQFITEKKFDDNENIILTPHPGEAAKLLGISNNEVQEDRINAAKQISKRFSAYVILKGKDTIICSKDNEDIFMCSEGGPELSSGGTGDVLAGVISALIAQKLNIIDACILSVAVHSRAGEIFKNKTGEIGLNASSLILTIRDLINK
ncbi:MAG: NAD(P)H-hydrate dehydratase [Gammaproteobacteria bacterium]|nr:NAD(P)H-hydrate dehydratase [Gammaproteobacteria bacterium]